MFDKRVGFLLAAIFLISLILRFLYFPQNIYFGFDQARDAFAAWDIIRGHLKLIGPPTSFEGLRHGVLYYYLYAPVYFLSKGNPAWVSAALRVVNCLGVFLIFYLARILFNRYVGLMAAFLFAISFEQTQFALYFNHPSLAVMSILVMYLGLSLLFFRKKDYGIIIALLGLGLSIQFEFLLTYLIVPFLLLIFFFKKNIPKLTIKIKLTGVLALILTLSSFILSEFKYGFRSFYFLSQLLFNSSGKSIIKILTLYFFEMGQVIKFNLTGFTEFKLFVALLLIVLFLFLLKSKFRKQLVFLGVWFFSVIIIYFVGNGADIKTEVIQYHPNVGIDLSLIIFVSFLFYLLGKKTHYLTVLAIGVLILATNLSLIQKINPYGSMPEINAQSFMLLSDEEKVVDFIYQDAGSRPFAVKAVTLPFYINTTWSYLFEWYGNKKYNYLPIWNGTNALGYPGNLKVEPAQDKAPPLRYLIIEPVRGIPSYLISDYLREESYFSDIKKEISIGQFKIQVRYKK